jgi:hypothetical protein
MVHYWCYIVLKHFFFIATINTTRRNPCSGELSTFGTCRRVSFEIPKLAAKARSTGRCKHQPLASSRELLNLVAPEIHWVSGCNSCNVSVHTDFLWTSFIILDPSRQVATITRSPPVVRALLGPGLDGRHVRHRSPGVGTSRLRPHHFWPVRRLAQQAMKHSIVVMFWPSERRRAWAVGCSTLMRGCFDASQKTDRFNSARSFHEWDLG